MLQVMNSSSLLVNPIMFGEPILIVEIHLQLFM